jgi:hypothetical protein
MRRVVFSGVWVKVDGRIMLLVSLCEILCFGKLTLEEVVMGQHGWEYRYYPSN